MLPSMGDVEKKTPIVNGLSKLKPALAFLEQRYLDYKRAGDKSFSYPTYPIGPAIFLINCKD
jgi:hypothetical protein